MIGKLIGGAGFMSKVYAGLAIMAVCGSALGATYFVGDARGYVRHQQEQLAAQAEKNKAMTEQRRTSRAKIAALQLALKEQREKDDVNNRKMLGAIKSYSAWWNGHAHPCGIAYAFGLQLDASCGGGVRDKSGKYKDTTATKTPNWILYKRILSGNRENHEGRAGTGQRAETRTAERN